MAAMPSGKRAASSSAFSALIEIGDVAQTCDEEVEDAVRAAERAVRDVVVVRCQSQDDPEDRFAFLLNAEEALGQPLSKELKAVLSLAFYKIARYQAQAEAKAKANANPAPF